MYRIYIAEDDESIAAAIARGLSAWDFEVRTASDFKRIADEIAEYDPHLVLLDITSLLQRILLVQRTSP